MLEGLLGGFNNVRLLLFLTSLGGGRLVGCTAVCAFEFLNDEGRGGWLENAIVGTGFFNVDVGDNTDVCEGFGGGLNFGRYLRDRLGEKKLKGKVN